MDIKGRITMDQRKLNILVVEDTKLAQKTAVMVLTTLGHDVDTADNGVESISKFKEKKYDIIFMDIGLPDIDGYTATETIRDIENKHIQPIIVALTAHIEDECKQKSWDAGMNDFVSKPLTTDKAEKIISKFNYPSLLGEIHN